MVSPSEGNKMLNKKKPIEAADIEKAAQEIERKKIALLQEYRPERCG